MTADHSDGIGRHAGNIVFLIRKSAAIDDV